MRGNYWLPAVIVLIGFACKNVNTVRGTDLMPGMAQADSLELLFFRSPDSPRYFTYVATTDKDLVKTLVSDVSGPVQPENQCLKEGKIYCFKKGEIFNTVFFAYEASDCTVLRYIKNGKLYYFPLSKELKKKLAAYKLIAREPVTEPVASAFLSNK